jgi:hypothetical protein
MFGSLASVDSTCIPLISATQRENDLGNLFGELFEGGRSLSQSDAQALAYVKFSGDSLFLEITLSPTGLRSLGTER